MLLGDFPRKAFNKLGFGAEAKERRRLNRELNSLNEQLLGLALSTNPDLAAQIAALESVQRNMSADPFYAGEGTPEIAVNTMGIKLLALNRLGLATEPRVVAERDRINKRKTEVGALLRKP